MKDNGSIESDSDMQLATVALLRASKKARALAARTRTEFVVIRDGRLVREIPDLDSQKSLDAQKSPAHQFEPTDESDS